MRSIEIEIAREIISAICARDSRAYGYVSRSRFRSNFSHFTLRCQDVRDQRTRDTSARIEESDGTWSLNETPRGTPTEIKEELSLVDEEDALYDYRSEDYDIPSDDRKLLDGLCRLGYFNGDYHLEEIMYLENIRRSQLLQLLDKFRDVLMTSECEDPAIALFYSRLGT